MKLRIPKRRATHYVCDDIVYSIWKHMVSRIKKKHKDQVLEEKEKFKKGFTEYLWEKEKAPEKLAVEVCEKVWRIIEDSSSYLF